MNKLKELYFAIQDGVGFSVKHDLSTYEGGGYAVGGASDSCECVYNDDLSFNKFRSIMDLNIEFMERQPDTTTQVIGTWVNWEEFDGHSTDVFIEVSDIVQDRAEAIALGKEREEEAIWDFKNNCEIKLK